MIYSERNEVFIGFQYDVFVFLLCVPDNSNRKCASVITYLTSFRWKILHSLIQKIVKHGFFFILLNKVNHFSGK